MFKRLALTTILTLTGSLAAAQGWTVTTSNGGSGSGSYACERANGTAHCNASGSFTDRNGYTRSWEQTRTRSAGQGSMTRNVTRRDGTTASYSRSWKR